MNVEPGDYLSAIAKLAGVEAVELPALVLRSFDWRLRPQYDAGGHVQGIALDLMPKVGLGVQLTAIFDRSEFVNLVTVGLSGLDAEDERHDARPIDETGSTG